MYSTTKMAKKLGVSTQTLRNWDRSGALVANRTPTGRMFYTQEQYLSAAGKDKYRAAGEDLDAISGKVVLITGGTGSLGYALVDRIHEAAKKVIIYSRCELKQAKMQAKFSAHNIRYLIGDIRDKDRLLYALRNVDVCIHAACMKRVETCTYNPFEAVKSNIIGSVNVVEACIENKVNKSLLVSTDKACAPATLYGGTKFVAEQVFINGNNYSTRDTKFMATRYGNVYGSNGSVAKMFKDQASKGGPMKVTHPDMTRFFMSLDEAVDLNLFALNNSMGGEIFIPKLKGTSMIEFARAFGADLPIEFIGLRGYEKIHEELISDTEMMYVVDCGNYYKIVPPNANVSGLGWDVEYPDQPKAKPFKYTSNAVEQFSQEELRELE